jgi:hypothetical protein
MKNWHHLTAMASAVIVIMSLDGLLWGSTFNTNVATVGFPFDVPVSNLVLQAPSLGSISVVGHNDVYTAPASTRAWAFNGVIFNEGAANCTYYFELKVSGVYYRLGGNVVAGTLTPSQVGPGLILEPGDSFGINLVSCVATGGPLHWIGRVIEYPSSYAIHTARFLGNMVVGDNTIYTVPAGKKAWLMDANGFPSSGAGSVGLQTNESGAPSTTKINIVPSGGTPGVTNQESTSTAVADGSLRSILGQVVMSAGDFISVNATGAGKQSAFVHVIEY